MKKLKSFIWIIIIGGVLGVVTLLYASEGKTPRSHIDTSRSAVKIDTLDTVPEFMSKSPKEGLYEALEHYEVLYPEIVHAQAILETGHFKSKACIEHNNLFGLYNSRKGEYYKFNHWTESVLAYKEWIQNRYKPNEDYYIFLKRINYAEDQTYTHKLKQIVKRNDKGRDTENSKEN